MTDTNWTSTYGENAIANHRDRIARFRALHDEVIARELAEIAKIEAEIKAATTKPNTTGISSEHVIYDADGVARARITHLRSARPTRYTSRPDPLYVYDMKGSLLFSWIDGQITPGESRKGAAPMLELRTAPKPATV